MNYGFTALLLLHWNYGLTSCDTHTHTRAQPFIVKDFISNDYLQFDLETRDPESGTWISERSHGGLVRGSEELEKWVNAMEAKFNEFHGDNLKPGGDIIGRTIHFIQGRLSHFNIPVKLVKTFVNTLFHHRLKDMNRNIQTSSKVRDLRSLKKTGHLLY